MKYIFVRCLVAFWFGLVKGCYVNTLEYRLRSDKKLFAGECFCTTCGAHIRFRDQIPVIGYLLLRGKCRSCGEPIGVHYPMIEAGCAVFYVLVALLTMPSAALAVLLSAVGVAVYIGVSLIKKKALRFSGKLVLGILSLMWMDALSWFGLTLVNIVS